MESSDTLLLSAVHSRFMNIKASLTLCVPATAEMTLRSMDMDRRRVSLHNTSTSQESLTEVTVFSGVFI